MEQQLLQSGTLQADSVAAALELSANIDGDFRGLRADVGDADDLNQVKELIETRLDAVERGVARFVANQTTRANEACTAVAQMSVRLKELEQQASSLRENLEAQQTRVMLDPLTGVLNRAGYNEAATKEYARWKRYGGALSLAVIDLDLFKRINDSFGHSAGDRVLATVAARLKEVVRESDILCRYGGEEFVLLLPATPAADALVLLEKLRAHIEHCPFRHRDTPVRVTISAGVAQVAASDTLDSVFERADAALYRAKGAGRNQVVSEFDNTATLANPS
jgi:diguanylate cyclase